MGYQYQSAQALLGGAMSLAALHAMIPSHWLGFAVVGRVQKWTVRRTVGITALAGAGHIFVTILLGALITVIGKAAQQRMAIPKGLEHAAGALALILLGGYYCTSAWQGRHACGHDHANMTLDEVEAHGHTHSHAPGVTPKTAVATLVLGMTLSPCMDLLPIYIAASTLSWGVVVAISTVMSITTLTLMITLVWLAQQGLMRFRMEWLERNEGTAVGVVLIGLGVLLLALPYIFPGS